MNFTIIDVIIESFCKMFLPTLYSLDKLRTKSESFSLLLTTRIMPCSVCNGNHVVITDPERGEIICSNCGHVMVDKIQETMQEWRAFNYTDKGNSRSRMGTTNSLARHDMGLYTIIGQTNRDASGHNLTAPVLSTIVKIKSVGQ